MNERLRPPDNHIKFVFTINPAFLKRILTIAAVTLAFKAVVSGAANFVMSGGDAVNVSSFNSGANWTGGAAPAIGNTYQTAAFLLRTPTNSAAFAFAGNSLEVQAGGDLRDKTPAAITVTNLILDNGGIFDMSGNGGSLAGNISLGGGTAFFSVGGGESFTCSSAISGSGGLNTYNTVSTGGIGTDILTTANTFSGGITVTNAVLQVNSTGGGNTPLGGVANNTGSTAAANVTVSAGGTLVGGGADSFGYYPHTAPATLLIAGGTVTDLGSSSYRVTLPNLAFTGGTLASAAGNNGDANGNYSLFGLGVPSTITTLSNNTTAVISAGKISLQQNNLAAGTTTFNIAAGGVTGGTTPGVDLLVSSVIANYSTEVGGLLKTGPGVMALDNGTNTFGGGITISNGVLQLGAANDLSALPAPLGTGAVADYAALSFASSQTVTVANVISGTGTLTVNNGTAVLTAANTYSGNTTVSNGTLLVNSTGGSGTGTGRVTVNAGGSLGGYGFISGSVTVNGKTLPGVNGATNTIGGSLTYNPGGAADFYLGASATGGGNDQIILNGAGGTLAGGGVSVGINCGAILDQADDYVLFNLTGASPVISGSFNATPVWLGTTPANASSYGILAVGGKVLLHFDYTGPTNLAVVTNLPASNLSFTSATVDGQVLSTGGLYPVIQIYYGLADGGTNPAAWTGSINLGVQAGTFAAALSNLTQNTAYYFTASASNSAGTAWAVPSQSFTTLTVVPAVVTNLPASNVQGASAILNGQVVATGSQTPAVTLYYGPADGGTNAAAWADNIYLGQQAGSFAVTVTGLSTNTAYHYAAAAENNAGTAWAQPSLAFTTLPAAPVVSVLTYHNDNARTGANTNETLLTPGTVNTNNFGRLISYAVDGFIFAQPLYVANLAIPGQGTHNVVFVATENDSIYAFDADNNAGVNGGLLWHTNLGSAPLSNNGEFGGRYHNGVYIDLTPEVGITGTPVIDPVSGTLYVDVLNRQVTTTTNYYHRIHALNIATGTEQPYSPVVVTASVPGTGVGGNGTVVTFNPQQQAQRPALTLAGGKLFVAYGSFADTDPYHGWVMGFNATNLQQLTNYIFNTTPNATNGAFGANAGEGALWMGGDGLCADTNNNLFFETANGSFSQNTNGGDYGDCFMKLATSNQLAVADYFSPSNQAAMQSADSDLGSGGPVLLPDSVGSAAHPHLIVGGGKAAIVFLVDRDNMGHFNANNDAIVQQFASGDGSFFGTPAYFNYQLYYMGKGGVMEAYTITNGSITTTPNSSSPASFAGFGITPAISANGNSNGIVWVIQTDGASPSDTGAAVLHAYSATNLAVELYNSSQNFTRDDPGPGVKYTVPTVADGKVYVGAQYALSVYGYTAFLATPVISPGGGTFTNAITLTLADATPGAVIYYTLDGTPPATGSLLYTNPFILTTNALVQAVAVKPGAVNSGVASASFINTAALGGGAGLWGQYWTNTSSTAFTNLTFNTPPTLTRTDAVVNFNWGGSGPSPAVGATNYAVLWTGTVQPQFSETYTFSTTADDGVRLYVNGQLLIDDWSNQPATTRSAAITLAAQQLYNIELDYYYSNDNGAQVELAWSSPSTPLAVIPQTQLYPYTNPPPTVVLASPASGASYTASASVTLDADADAPYNPVSGVSFYANSTLLGTVTNVPYTITATGLGAGSYALTAVAVDGSGLSSTSAPVGITVVAGSGQPYGLTSNGAVPAFFNMPTTFNSALPTLLSQTGVFSNTPAMTPAGGLIPYLPNVPLWSDGALKTRYLAVPNTGGVITPAQQITFAPAGTWTFPAGTIFVKTFALQTNQSDPDAILRLETRLLVRDINGAVYGVTYKWRADNSDADLLTTSSNQVVTIITPAGTTNQTWYYPSPSDCLACHTPVANYVLGVSTRQLNNNQTYPATGVTDNQLRTLNRLGLFNPAFDEAAIPGFEALSALTNLTASLQERSRSYLDANCAQCHQPGGTGITFDARYDTPLVDQNITNYPASFSLGYDHALIIAPQDIWRSMIYQRMNTLNNTIKMPTLARNLIDTNAVAVFTAWINSLPGIPTIAPPVISPNGGTFYSSVNVTLSPPDTNAAVYYTLDGSLPTTNSFLYAGVFSLTNSALVSASAFEAGSNNSVAAAALFTMLPLYFTSSGFLPDGQFQLQFAGTTGSNYVLQATTNFTGWTSLITNTATTNFFNLLDPQATNYPYRFYRVVQQ